VEAARRKFSPEFMNRLDKVVGFSSIAADATGRSAEIELDRCSSECRNGAGAVLVSRDECGRIFCCWRERTSDTERTPEACD